MHIEIIQCINGAFTYILDDAIGFPNTCSLDNIDAISRHEDSIRTKIKVIHMSQESITEHMFPIVESEELITECSQQIEESLNTDNKDAFLV